MQRLRCGNGGFGRHVVNAGHGWLVGVVAGMLMLAVGTAQEPSTKKAKGRLPPYYAQVVNDQQRQAIYAIQEKYGTQIAALQEQIAALTRQRDAEIEKVLTPEQRAKLQELREAGAAKRKKGTSDENSPEGDSPPGTGSPAAGSAKAADAKPSTGKANAKGNK